MSALKLTAIGNSVGLILPKEVLARLGVGKGDTLFAVETDGGLRLTTGASPNANEELVTRTKDVIVTHRGLLLLHGVARVFKEVCAVKGQRLSCYF